MPNTLQRHLGHKLADAIKLKGVQQSEVATYFEVKRPTVSSDWLKHGRIAKKHYPKLVEFFELPYEWWFGAVKRDQLREQLLFFYSGLSIDARHELARQANIMYSKEHPDDRGADPFHSIEATSGPKIRPSPPANIKRKQRES